jgi:hypothetical protein
MVGFSILTSQLRRSKMNNEDLDAEIVSLALGMDDEFGEDEDTVKTISELLRISHIRVLEVLLPDTIGG